METKQERVKRDIDWNDLDMITNSIVIETMSLYQNGDLEKLKKGEKQ